MDVYKLRTGLQPVKRIEAEQFERDTDKKPPWYQENGDSLYAVCPACDNPIQICALYSRNENSPTPYGKHIARSIADLASYDHEAYTVCPYANPKLKLEKVNLRSETDQKSVAVLTLLREQFDRVIHILQQETGIVITAGLARSLLRSFLGMKGERYIGTNLCNLPWMFGYMTTSQTLFGRIIKEDSPLMAALKKHRELSFHGNQVKGSGNKFIDLNFTFLAHKIRWGESGHKETIEFVVSLGETKIFNKVIEVDPMRFHNLVNLPEEKSHRNQSLLNIAAEIIHL